ncbi:hypothetical protein [Halegenticoccus soli]|uniref:hypothetical protein n=1 Tax=Halegenticoccus soli TaxID=1985678 RepID=UPI0018ED841B|nr:hypothetical protein [Halegenticoccus soli]
MASGEGESRSAASAARFLDGRAALHYLRVTVYVLASLVGLSLLVIGTVAVIAEVKGTWHWAIHLQSTVSYMGAFIGAVLIVLVPSTAALFVGRWWIDG